METDERVDACDGSVAVVGCVSVLLFLVVFLLLFVCCCCWLFCCVLALGRVVDLSSQFTVSPCLQLFRDDWLPFH